MTFEHLPADVNAAYEQEGTNLDYTNGTGSALPAGTIVDLGGGLTGVTINDIPDGELGTARIAGVFSVRKAAATTFTVGAAVDWDDTNKLAVATGDFNLGVAAAAGVNGEDSVEVLFNAPVAP